MTRFAHDALLVALSLIVLVAWAAPDAAHWIGG